MNGITGFFKVLLALILACFFSFMLMNSSGGSSSNSKNGDSNNSSSSNSAIISKILSASLVTMVIIVVFVALLSSAFDVAGWPFDNIEDFGSVRRMWEIDKMAFVNETARLVSLVIIATLLGYIIPKGLFGDKIISNAIRLLIIVFATLVLNMVVYNKVSSDPKLSVFIVYLQNLLTGVSTLAWGTCTFSKFVANITLGEKIAASGLGTVIIQYIPDSFLGKLFSKSFSTSIIIIAYMFIIEYLFGDIGVLINTGKEAISSFFVGIMGFAIMVFFVISVIKAITK